MASARICRACQTTKGDFSHVLFENLDPDIYYFCTSVEIYPDDELPKTICNSCYDYIAKYAEFKSVCIQSENALRGYKDSCRSEEDILNINSKCLEVYNSKIKKEITDVSVKYEDTNGLDIDVFGGTNFPPNVEVKNEAERNVRVNRKLRKLKIRKTKDMNYSIRKNQFVSLGYSHYNINILHQNIDSLTVKSKLLAEHLDNLGNNIDVLCITEHNISELNTSNEEYCPNFRLVTNFSRNTNRGGACIFVRNGHVFTVLPYVAEQSKSGHIEMCGIELYSLIIICVYRPPRNNYKTFYDRLDIVLKRIYSQSDKKVVLCGDFNINVLERDSTTLNFEHFLLCFDLSLSFYEPTRPSSGRCVDNFAHNLKIGFKAQVIDLYLSDHTSQLLNVTVKKICKLDYWKVDNRDYSKQNMIQFRKNLQNISFVKVYQSNDANFAFEQFYELFSFLYKQCFPKTKIKTYKKCKWLSCGNKSYGKKHRHVLWNFRSHPTKIAKMQFKDYTTFYRKMKFSLNPQRTQSVYHNNKKSGNNCKALSRLVSEYNTNLPLQQITKVTKSDLTLTHPDDIANAFNDYFVDEIEIDVRNNKLKLEVDHLEYTESRVIRPVLVDDIIFTIRSLENEDMVGYCNVIKYVNKIVSPVLAHIVNLCITKGVYPLTLKNTIITPIHHQDKRTNMKNYRPIAKISIFSKILENIIYNLLYSYVSEHSNLTSNVRKDNDIYDFLGRVIKSKGLKKSTCAIYADNDMTRVLDYVNHKTLLNTMHSYGIRDNILQLLESYLSNRTQRIQITRLCTKRQKLLTFLSKPRTLNFGVPQGSILRHLFFLFYLGHYPKMTLNEIVLLPEVNVIDSITHDNYQSDINTTLANIYNWHNRNNLVLNIMHFNKRTQKPRININCVVKEVNVVECLGLYIDDNLDWKMHIHQLHKKINKATHELIRISTTAKDEALLRAYYDLVDTNLRCGIIFWGKAKAGIKIIFEAQKICIKAMFNLARADTCVPLFKSRKILTLPSIYILEICMFIKANLNLFEFSNRKNDSRKQYKNVIAKNNSVLGDAPDIYNRLPNVMRALDIVQFKEQLESLLIDKCYYSIEEYFREMETLGTPKKLSARAR